MTRKTEENLVTGSESRPDFSRPFIWWMVVLTCATIILTLTTMDYVPRDWRYLNSTSFLFPWLLAGETSIRMGIAEFSGKAFTPPPGHDALFLVSLSLLYIAAPTVLLFGWVRHYRKDGTARDQVLFRPAEIPMFFAGVVTVGILIAGFPAAFNQIHAFRSMHEGQTDASNRDEIIMDCTKLGFSALEYRVRPLEMDGGGRSFAGFQIPGTFHSRLGNFSIVEQSANTMEIEGRWKDGSPKLVRARLDSVSIIQLRAMENEGKE